MRTRKCRFHKAFRGSFGTPAQMARGLRLTNGKASARGCLRTAPADRDCSRHRPVSTAVSRVGGSHAATTATQQRPSDKLGKPAAQHDFRASRHRRRHLRQRAPDSPGCARAGHRTARPPDGTDGRRRRGLSCAGLAGRPRKTLVRAVANHEIGSGCGLASSDGHSCAGFRGRSHPNRQTHSSSGRTISPRKRARSSVMWWTCAGGDFQVLILACAG